LSVAPAPSAGVATGAGDPEALSGVGALVRLLLLRNELDGREGLSTATMVSGYPGSPLGTLDLALDAARPVLDTHRVLHRPGLNEELAAATVWGSQMGAAVPYHGVDGVVGVWYGKAPGLDRSGDVLKHGNAMGSGPNGGTLLLCGDDPSAKSSTLTCDSQYTFQDACIPVLYPGDQQDIIDLGIEAFRLSRAAGCWVGFKVVTSVADGTGSVASDLERFAPSDRAEFELDGRRWRHEPLRTIGPHQIPDQETLVSYERLLAAEQYAERAGLNRVMGGPRGRLGIVCAGKTYFDVVQALSDAGVPLDELAARGLRILKLGMTYPLVTRTVLDFAGSVDHVVVVEEKRPFVEAQLRSILHEARSTVPVSGKRDLDGRPLVSPVGELDARAVASVLGRLSPDLAPPERPVRTASLPLVEVPPRPPAFCSGCPHNRSTVVPVGALVGGGVGCHGIMYFEARQRGMKSLPPTPMGAEGVPWLGLAPFVDEPHLIQNLGDGTLSHSGTLAIRASVAAGVNVTFKILYNAAVAMTGGQDVTGLMDVPSLSRALEAEGVAKVVVCAEDPGHYGREARWARGVEVHGRERLAEVQDRLRDVSGVTVIVYDQRCAAEARRLRKRGLLEDPPRRVFINEAVCEGCGDCTVKSNCLSVVPVVTEFGEKRRIHEASCNKDYSCLEGDCPSFVTVMPAPPGRRDPRSGRTGRRGTTGSGGTSGGSTSGRSARRWSRRSAGRPRAAVAPLSPRVAPPLPSGTLPSPGPASIGAHGYSVYFTGIGGTGVVTAARIMELAAESRGLVVNGLDQTGLSQKAGAVVSHLRMATDRNAIASSTVGVGGADLYISGDILQAASGRHLDRVDPGRTLAVVDTTVTPTAGMLQTDSSGPDHRALAQVLDQRVGGDRLVLVDSKRIAEAFFGSHILANIVLVGAAFQRGALPFGADAVRGAIGNGKGAQDNWEAFEWGRWAVHDPAVVDAALEAAELGTSKTTAGLFEPSAAAVRRARTLVRRRTFPADLATMLERRTAQVVDYQDAALAEMYLDLVGRVAGMDDAGHGWRLTRAVAESWFKLLTYKDEYEVARLHLRVDYDEVARELGIEGPYSVTYHLHPPVLRRLGMRNKLALGASYEAAFRVLHRMRRLRGTPFDVFGWDRDRRMERALVAEYRQLVLESLADASVSYDGRVAVAESVLMVKGYAEVKERSVQNWRDRVAALRRDVPVSA
jgi:indolepyruvate ferredoxin oxidoreductase